MSIPEDEIISRWFRIAAGEDITGVAELQGQVYIVNSASDCIQVYTLDGRGATHESDKFKRQDDIIIKPKKLLPLFGESHNEVDPADLVASVADNCLYVSDYGNWCIWRVTINPREGVKRWVTLNKTAFDSNPQMALAVMSDGRLFMVCDNPPRLECYHRDAAEIKPTVIILPADFKEPMHAVELESGNFVVSHGWTRSPLRRLCEVSRQGKLVRTFGGAIGAGDGQLNCPVYMAVDEKGRVFVADYFNNRVQLVDSSLADSSVVLRWEGENETPVRLFYAAETCRVLVAMRHGHVDVYST